ncbi:MAG TPA: LacI family DNA-binding transcriptional regulator [Chitinophagaceae bacterium]|nr:LacI family DNA-binding transcriptional regulator [Chitinophagales bacterium]HRX93616.1 LacI family DNA-binding transcriptional regulator [Chitinophagaceae bacterium]
MSQKPATIKEIAKRLNVSVSTVSRALHDHLSIGLKTKMEVRKMAAELNYEPNQAAISFKKGKTMTLGVILPNLSEEFFSIAINGIEDIATQNDYTVLIGQSHDDVNREIQIADTMRKHRVDGILVSLAKTTKNYDHFEQLKALNIPVVFFDRLPDLENINAVSCNLENSSVELVDWLVNAGHKRIGFIKGPDNLVHSQQRLTGYKHALQKNRIELEDNLMVATDLSSEKTAKAMQKLLSLKKPPTAVIAFNDYVALDAMQYAKTHGLQINKDIFFGSYANLPLTTYLDNPPIVSVEQFPYEQAEKATEILLGLINDPKGTSQNIVLESSLVVRKK